MLKTELPGTLMPQVDIAIILFTIQIAAIMFFVGYL